MAELAGHADVRERALWWLVHESGASTDRAVALDVDVLACRTGARTTVR